MVYIGVSEGVIVTMTSLTSSAIPMELYVVNVAKMYSFHGFRVGVMFPSAKGELLLYHQDYRRAASLLAFAS